MPVTSHPPVRVSSNRLIVAVAGCLVAGDYSPVLAFSERVKRARKHAGMTQAQLASAMGVSLSAVRDWEARGRNPREVDVYRSIAVTTGVPADFILGITDELPGEEEGGAGEPAAPPNGSPPPPSEDLVDAAAAALRDAESRPKRGRGRGRGDRLA